MSGIVIKAPAVLFRIYFELSVVVLRQYQTLMILGIIAALGMIAGSLMAIAQSELKRMLAYSSVAQIGYVFWDFFR